MTNSAAEAAKKLSAVGHAISGAGGAVLALTVTYPLDIIKTRLQCQTKDSKFSTKYASTLDAFRQILAKEGPVGLYAGLPSALIGTASSNFAYFFWYSFIRRLTVGMLARQRGVRRSQIQFGIVLELVLGAVAGAISQMFTIPVSVITTRQQTQISEEEASSSSSSGKSGKTKKRPLTMGETALVIIEEEGWTGLWKGLRPSLVLTANPAITYGFFESMKTSRMNTKKEKGLPQTLSSMEVFMLGLLSKTIATVVTYPYIMAKVRLQWKPSDYKENAKLQYKSAVDVLKRVYETDGPLGWYKGLQAQISKAVLSQALLFVIKDKLTLFTYLLFKAIQSITDD